MPVQQIENADRVPVRDAATIALLRDAPAGGLEIFMVRRNQKTAFGPGDYVFPGGAVDKADSSLDLYTYCNGMDDARASARLRVEKDGLSAWIAAIRECFEEAGVLLALGADKKLVSTTAGLSSERTALHARKTVFADVCTSRNLRLAVDQLHYYNHWITPVGPPRRYSTRFFAAELPSGQVAQHDGVETVAGEWVAPSDALARGKAGDFPMLFPTIAQLRYFRGFSTVSEALDAVRNLKDIPTVAPYLARDSEGRLQPVLPGGGHVGG